jgi:hypothetical protein
MQRKSAIALEILSPPEVGRILVPNVACDFMVAISARSLLDKLNVIIWAPSSQLPPIVSK